MEMNVDSQYQPQTMVMGPDGFMVPGVIGPDGELVPGVIGTDGQLVPAEQPQVYQNDQDMEGGSGYVDVPVMNSTQDEILRQSDKEV